MTPREHLKNLMAGQPVSAPGFWLGKPHPDTLHKFNEFLGTKNLEEIQYRLGDDVRWVTPQHDPNVYQHPDGCSMRPWRDANPHGLCGVGLLSAAESVEDLDRITFANPDYLDFTDTLARLDACGSYYRLSGFWASFFHDLCYLFGTEELLCLMVEQPEIVHEATRRICTFYLEANERFYRVAGDKIDAHFFGNDFGMQQGLLISPAHFREFFLPWIQKFADQAHAHGIDSVLHSCGGIAHVIDDLIEAGVNGLHPMQTAAVGMSPEILAATFGGRITFWGGVDTQQLLQIGRTADVDREVQKLAILFENRIVIGPSHEALLPSVSLENVLQIPRSLHRGFGF